MVMKGTALHSKMQQIFDEVKNNDVDSMTKLEFWRDDEDGNKDLIVLTTADLLDIAVITSGVKMKLVLCQDRFTVYINPDERLQDSLYSMG